jgi:predicted nucleic acid-binding protein
VYRFDARDPRKQAIADSIVRDGIQSGELIVPHQAVVEFVRAVTRPQGTAEPLLSWTNATQEAEELLAELPVVYPNEHIVRTALRGVATYQLGWFDAHLWACAEYFGIGELLSEDFQHDRLYGTVRIRNPFFRPDDDG